MWIPGIDHAGIATQSVVEKSLQKSRGVLPKGLSRLELLGEIQRWVELHSGIIRRQIDDLNIAVDQTRFYFTKDAQYSSFVTKSFVRLFDMRYIFRDTRAVNWCPALRSVISDIEVTSEPIQQKTVLSLPNGVQATVGLMYVIQFSPEISVHTTRPETCFADCAIAVHPSDTRYSHLVGGSILHPITQQQIPIVSDCTVSPGFGSGVVKVTPAHDPTDFEVASRNGISKFASCIDESGRIFAPKFPEYHVPCPGLKLLCRRSTALLPGIL